MRRIATICSVEAVRIAAKIAFLSVAISLSVMPLAYGKVPKELACDFGEGSDANWDSGKLEIERANFGKNGVTRYTSIDLDKGTATYTTDAGSEDVSIIQSAKGLSFVEVLPTGISIATVFNAPQPSDKFYAVISRHIDFMGANPSQYYGTCVVAK